MKKTMIAIVMVALSLSMAGVAFATNDVVSRMCEKHETWILDSDDVLNISGTGAMNHYGYDNGICDTVRVAVTPRESNQDKIKSKVIGDGVTLIGNGAFVGYKNRTSVSVPASIFCIQNAFTDCTNIDNVYYIGQKMQWNSIMVDSLNKPLINANNNFNYLISSGVKDMPNTAWSEAYKNFVLQKQFLAAGQRYNTGHESNIYGQEIQFLLYDLERDGIPELFVNSGYGLAGPSWYVYRYDGKKISYWDTVFDGHGVIIEYVPNSAYPGLFIRPGIVTMGYKYIGYYGVENDQITYFSVAVNDTYGKEPGWVVEHAELYQAYQGEKQSLKFFTLPEIQTMGWEEFVRQYTRTFAVRILVNGNGVQWTDATPFIDANSRTMVPLRAVGEALGLTVGWDDSTRTASFSRGGRTVFFPINSSIAWTSEGQAISMDTAAVIEQNRTYAPVRYLAEYFGYTVGWDGDSKTVNIQSVTI